MHKERLVGKGCYSAQEIRKAVNDVEVYKQMHLERPGFFDTAINTGTEILQRLRESELEAIVALQWSPKYLPMFMLFTD